MKAFTITGFGRYTETEVTTTIRAAGGDLGGERSPHSFANGRGYCYDPYNGTISDKCTTLGVNCGMSTGRSIVIVLNDQGGGVMSVSYDKTATLRAAEHGHQPIVFCLSPGYSKCYEAETAPTLDTRVKDGANRNQGG